MNPRLLTERERKKEKKKGILTESSYSGSQSNAIKS